MLSGTFNQLLTYTGFAVVLFSGLAVSVAVRAALAQPERTAAVPRVGVSARAGHLRARVPRDCRQRDHARARAVGVGPAADGVGRCRLYWWLEGRR